MDNSSPPLTGSCSPLPCNGSMRRPSPGPLTPPGVAGGRPASLMDHNQSQPHVVRVVVNRDDRGYGMKVSGDNPVYVQSVKEGGAAERAGLHAGDKIIKVNGVNVMQSTHTEVVALIRSSSQVVLTVQQRLPALRAMGSPSMHNRPVTTPTSSRITGPQPVDNEKQHQLQQEKEQYYRLMIEKEQHYLDLLRSQIASSPDEKKCAELAKTERNLQTLQAMLQRSQAEQQSPSPVPSAPCSPSSRFPTPRSPRPNTVASTVAMSPNGNSEVPPPLPRRNNPPRQRSNAYNNRSNTKPSHLLHDINSLFINNEINANVMAASLPDRPPPLPPRNAYSAPLPLVDSPSDAVNSINKQMSYPLVATCATLVNDYSPNSNHHRTKSTPESCLALAVGEGMKKHLSESLNDLSRPDGWETAQTPPGTPPPPYPSPQPNRRDRSLGNADERDHAFEENFVDESSPDVSPFRANSSSRILANSSPIHAANPQMTQQPIISMEDDEISDQEISQLEDHGHFKSLSRLWEHLPHLAVFMNYVVSNSDPNSLLFYLLTDLYKEGNAKEMRKWAFEIHSCFLVPGAPLRLNNVDENVALEIDLVLSKESDREERLKKIFLKARSRAKEELKKQLTDFKQKRTAGLGTMFGPTDQDLQDVYHDKAKETKLYETLLLQKLEPYLEEIDKENYDPKRYYTAAALTTVLARVFQIRPSALDRCPTFVNKERSFRTKFIGKYSRKLSILGHQFVAQQYYTVIACNNCHQIIYGIGPQGYQCSACLINLHRPCVKLYDDSCPGPITKKDRGIRKLIGMRHDSNDHNRIKKPSHFIQMEKERRQLEERDNSFETMESGEVKPGQPVSRSGSDRRPDAVREEAVKQQDSGVLQADVPHEAVHDKNESNSPESSVILPVSGTKRKVGSNINRSESVKEQSEKRKQRRNISDPSHNTSCDVDQERQQGLSKNTDSGSSSNSSISCNGRLSESPSNRVDVVHQAQQRTNTDSDSDMDGEAEPLNWQQFVTEEELKNLNSHDKKRQDVINELFHTEGSHVRFLKVLYKIFYKTLQESQILKKEELNLIFPNIKEMVDIHTEFNKEMRRRRKEDPLVKGLGDMLVKMFGGPQGEALQKAAATFCERQQLALEFIKKRRERDSKFDTILAGCEKKRQCRRLQLQAIIPTEMQRLSKYPLLLERLISSVEDNKDNQQPEELAKLQRAHNMSKDILNYVNEAAKVALNQHRLEEIQKHLDTSNFERADYDIVKDFRTLDLPRYRLVLEGSMQLRRPSKPPAQVHVLLLEEMVVILHKEGDSRFSLKFFQSGSPAQPLSPIIKMNTLLVRNNAACKNALFLVNTSENNMQMFDLIAEDENKREVWFKHFSDAADAYNKRVGKAKRQGAAADDSDTEVVQDLPATPDVSEHAEAVSVEEDSPARTESQVEDIEAAASNEPQEQPADRETFDESSEPPEMVAGGGVQTTKVSAEEWPLIQPSQVSVVVPPVHVPETMLTSLEQIRRKDALVKQALADKEGLVADMLSIPREHFQHIADMAGMDNTSNNRDLSERVLASIFQVDLLQKAVNSALNVTEAEVMAAKGGRHPACASQESSLNEQPVIPSVPASLVRDVATSLSSQLTTLLSEMKHIEEERDRLRKELHKMRERIHEEHNLHSPVQFDECASDESAQEIFCEAGSGEQE